MRKSIITIVMIVIGILIDNIEVLVTHGYDRGGSIEDFTHFMVIFFLQQNISTAISQGRTERSHDSQTVDMDSSITLTPTSIEVDSIRIGPYSVENSLIS